MSSGRTLTGLQTSKIWAHLKAWDPRCTHMIDVYNSWAFVSAIYKNLTYFEGKWHDHNNIFVSKKHALLNPCMSSQTYSKTTLYEVIMFSVDCYSGTSLLQTEMRRIFQNPLETFVTLKAKNTSIQRRNLRKTLITRIFSGLQQGL